MVLLRILAMLLVLGAWLPAAAQERVDLELVLLADASRSIDDVEIKLQREGYAAGITHSDVLDTILGGYYRRIAVTYVEWGDETSQEIVVPWTIIDGPKAAATFARKLRTMPRWRTASSSTAGDPVPRLQRATGRSGFGNGVRDNDYRRARQFRRHRRRQYELREGRAAQTVA